ncbi:DNA-directed RNA polymerase III subunit RPC5 [Blomia tropicalis]|nr:DNA-directed RNA polymerase III subunit RPC5 [Blomia tropicalis]
MVKEEISDEESAIPLMPEPEDEIIASYDIVPINSVKHKIMSIAGLNNIIQNVNKYDISIRTDLKELKISTKFSDGTMSVCYTEETNHNLDKRFYAIKLSRETGNAYFVPVTSLHLISFIDEANRFEKELDDRNMIFEDGFKLPHPGRNKHEQLCLEMKNYLYKPLKCIKHPEMVKHSLTELLDCTIKRQPHSFHDSSNTNKVENNTNETLDIVSGPYWQLDQINLFEVRHLEAVELQIEALLRKGQAMKFDEIRTILSIDDTKILSVLPTIAILVQGNWVIKSNLLYKVNPFHDNDAKQNHYKDLSSARDFILWNFATKRKLLFSEIYTRFKKTADHENILDRLTILDGFDEAVRFILPEDEYSSILPNIHKNSVRLLEKHKGYLET